MALKTITAQRGEWFEFGAKLTDPVTKLPRDVAGKAVSLTVRDGPLSTDDAVTITGSASGIVSASGGDVWAGGRCATAGKYYATVTVGSASDGRGWPAVEMGLLEIKD